MKSVIVAVLLFSQIVLSSDRLSVWLANLTHDNPLIRKNAIIHLGRLRDKHAIEPLLELVGKSESETDCIEAINALLKMPTMAVYTAFRKQVAQEKKANVRRKLRHAIEILEQLKEKNSLDPRH